MPRLFFAVCLTFFLVPLALCPAKDKTGQTAKNAGWKPLFDGKTLKNWTVPAYGGEGKITVKDRIVIIGNGETMSGIRYEKEFPKINYEIRYEAQRTKGSDFFAACTFPVKKEFCTFINGGWGGSLTGLSSVDHLDASENITATSFEYKDGVWYRFRISVTETHIRVWITPPNTDSDKKEKPKAEPKEELVIELETKDRELSVRSEMSSYQPLGFCTWSSEGQIRNAEYRILEKK
ncbi:MAG: DUF1080 domain-containing protein [Planctomycetaceae bacterium]|nr:DUF1080 domain-containing protein [Planctomycetaceae bacterium]